jgi:Holliday junction resolvase RusA-like endonuclease
VYLRFHMDPVPKGRHRITRSGRAYTPAKTRDAERIVKGIASRTLRGFRPYDEPLSVELRFVMPKPAKPKFHVPASKPDLDNLSKLILDALNGIAWIDDARIVQLSSQKIYGSGATPIGIHVSIKPFIL